MINDDRRKIAARLYEKHAKLGAVLVHPDGSDPSWTVEELFEVLGLDYAECQDPWECPYEYIADLIDVPTCRDLVYHQPDPFNPTQPMQDGFFECSDCGWHGRLWEYIGFGDIGAFVPNYCPECGAEILGKRQMLRRECIGEIQAKQAL